MMGHYFEVLIAKWHLSYGLSAWIKIVVDKYLSLPAAHIHTHKHTHRHTCVLCCCLLGLARRTSNVHPPVFGVIIFLWSFFPGKPRSHSFATWYVSVCVCLYTLSAREETMSYEIKQADYVACPNCCVMECTWLFDCIFLLYYSARHSLLVGKWHDFRRMAGSEPTYWMIKYGWLLSRGVVAIV